MQPVTLHLLMQSMKKLSICKKNWKKRYRFLTSIPLFVFVFFIKYKSALSVTDYLVKDGRTNTSRICSKNTPGAKKAVLSYEILETSEVTGLSVVQIHLGTGRHHQIRVQMAGAGAPLWGDNKYNPEFVNKRGYFPIALRAFRLSFCHPTTGKRMEFEVPCNWEQLETKAD